MPHPEPQTVLFVSSTYKGIEMIRAVKSAGLFVLLLIEEELRDEPWPTDIIDEIFYTPDLARYRDVIHTVAYLCRGRHIDYVVPLDEFEVELVAMLREHLRLPGMGITAVRRFRDKLVMREVAHAAGIPVPDFVQVKNYDDLRDYMERVPAPWVLKPRAEASAMGIQKITDSEQLWRALDALGDKQSYYLLERFMPGDVYHCDSIIVDDKIIFSSVQQYGAPPMTVYQGGGVFNSRVLSPKSPEAKLILKQNKQIIKALGMNRGVTHAEFIRSADGTFNFLEIAARVGGANIADMIAHATNVNLWHEWGRLVISELTGEPYTLPETKNHYAGLLMTLARQQHPDMSTYNDSEVVWTAEKEYHAGLIIASPSADRIDTLLADYTTRFLSDFTAVADPSDTQRTGQTDI